MTCFIYILEAQLAAWVWLLLNSDNWWVKLRGLINENIVKSQLHLLSDVNQLILKLIIGGKNIHCLKFRKSSSVRMHKSLKHLQNHLVSELISMWATIQIFLLFFKTRCWEIELHHLCISIIVFKPCMEIPVIWKSLSSLLLHLPCPLPLIKQECPDCLDAWGLLLPLVVWIE